MSLISECADILKTIFPDGTLPDLASRERVLLTKLMAKSMDDMYGDSLKMPLKLRNPQGASRNPALAYEPTSTSLTGVGYESFLLTRYADFHAVPFNREMLIASSKNEGAFVKVLGDGVSSMLDELLNRLALAIYGDGSASIGKRASISTETVTLEVPSTARNFAKGQQLEVLNGAGPSKRTITAGSGQGGLYVTVASVDAANGKFTLTTGDAAAIGSFGNNDQFIVAGDQGVSGTTTTQGAMPGLGAWIPLAAPSATTFYGVDRTVDSEKLAGFRLDNSNGDIGDNFLTVAENVRIISKKNPTDGFIHPLNFSALSRALSSRIIADKSNNGSIDYGFDTIRVRSSGGPIDIWPDPMAPINLCYVVDMDALELHTMGKVPMMVNFGGEEVMQPVNGTNNVMVKGVAYTGFGVNSPGSCGVFSI